MQNDFYNVLTDICIEHNETVSGAAKAIGLSGAAATGWKKGKKPTYITLVKLSRHFNLSLDVFKDFLDNEEEKAPVETDERVLSPALQELVDLLYELPDEKVFALLDLVKSALRMI